MMRLLLVCALTAAALLPAAARADDAVTLAPAIAQCINDNAAKVEAAVPDLNQAVEFLVSDVCAESVAAEQAQKARQSAERMQGQWKKVCDEETAEKKKTAADYCAVTKIGIANAADDEDGGYTIYAPSLSSAPPAAIALAAKRLLDLRLSHAKTKASGG
jgi:hypothetical protein